MKRSRIQILLVLVLMITGHQSVFAIIADDCGPGYWTQSKNLEKWQGFEPEDLFLSVGFADAFPGMSLIDVLTQDGDGVNALARHGVAAMLNAASPERIYPYETNEVIALFNAYSGYLAPDLALAFEEFNELSCDI